MSVHDVVWDLEDGKRSINANSGVDIDGAGVIAAILAFNETCERLWLSHNEFGDAGVIPICEALRINETLQTLYLARVKMGVQGAFAVAAMLRENRTLKELRLDDNEIGDEGFNHTLETIYVSRNGITLKGAKVFAEAVIENSKASCGLERVTMDGRYRKLLKGCCDKSNNVIREWSPERNHRYIKELREQVFQVMLMWNHDEYEEGECEGIKWNELPIEVVLRILKWLALMDKTGTFDKMVIREETKKKVEKETD